LDAAVVSTEASYTNRIRQGFGHGYDTASILVRVQGASANPIDRLAQEIRPAGNVRRFTTAARSIQAEESLEAALEDSAL
jgi:hypothetical protein